MPLAGISNPVNYDFTEIRRGYSFESQQLHLNPELMGAKRSQDRG